MCGNRLAGLLALILLGAQAYAAQHNSLLPSPQEIRYGAGHLRVRGLRVVFGSTPAPEDRFAAEELAGALSAKCHCVISLGSASAQEPLIRLVRVGPVDALPGSRDKPGADSRESYNLSVTPQGAEIRAKTSAGLFYGVQTFIQMVETDAKGALLPEAQVRDWPSLAYRGFMMDMSHGPLPTEDEVKYQIDFLARWKANQYYFYSEASIELDGYPLLNPDGRFTQDQIRRIVAYARERHVDVVPCTELFGHLHDLFRLERYSDLSPRRYGDELNPADPRVLPLLENWVAQLTRLFPSPWFHIGFDEAWDLESFGSKAAGVGPSQLYMDFLRTVDKLVSARGKRVVFWADVTTGSRVFTRYPDLLSQLPRDLIAAPWDYRDEKDYSPQVAPLAQAGIPTVVATGVWNWNEIYPDLDRSFANIDGFLADGRKYGIIGLMNTGWTDDAQASYKMSLPGIAYGGVAAWQSVPVNRTKFLEEYCDQVYPHAIAVDVAAALSESAGSEVLLSRVLENPNGQTMYAFWDDPFTAASLQHSQAHESELRQARLLAEDAEEHLDRAMRVSSDATALRSLILGTRMLDYLGMKKLYAVELAGYFDKARTDSTYVTVLRREGSLDHAFAADLMDEITTLRPQYERAWREEYTPYRLGTALGRWDAEYQFWRNVQMRLLSLRSVDNVASLDSLLTQH
jgi:hexosaminidase